MCGAVLKQSGIVGRKIRPTEKEGEKRRKNGTGGEVAYKRTELFHNKEHSGREV